MDKINFEREVSQDLKLYVFAISKFSEKGASEGTKSVFITAYGVEDAIENIRGAMGDVPYKAQVLAESKFRDVMDATDGGWLTVENDKVEVGTIQPVPKMPILAPKREFVLTNLMFIRDEILGEEYKARINKLIKAVKESEIFKFENKDEVN